MSAKFWNLVFINILYKVNSRYTYIPDLLFPVYKAPLPKIIQFCKTCMLSISMEYMNYCDHYRESRSLNNYIATDKGWGRLVAEEGVGMGQPGMRRRGRPENAEFFQVLLWERRCCVKYGVRDRLFSIHLCISGIIYGQTQIVWSP